MKQINAKKPRLLRVGAGIPGSTIPDKVPGQGEIRHGHSLRTWSTPKVVYRPCREGATSTP